MEAKRIKYSDIVRAFSMKLYEHFPDIEIMDVEKDFPRPAFFTRLDIEETGHFMTRHIDSDLVFRIYYFPSDPEHNEFELLEIRNELEYIFLVKENRLIEVNGVFLEILDIGMGLVDGVVHFYLFFNLSQEIIDDSDDTPVMENLEIEGVLANKHWADNNIKPKETTYYGSSMYGLDKYGDTVSKNNKGSE